MKNNKIKTATIVFGLTLLVSSTAIAQQRNQQNQQKPPTFSELLEQMDANEDGKLSKDEIKGPLKDNFDTVDANEDGFISKEEFDKAPKPKRKEQK